MEKERKRGKEREGGRKEGNPMNRMRIELRNGSERRAKKVSRKSERIKSKGNGIEYFLKYNEIQFDIRYFRSKCNTIVRNMKEWRAKDMKE